ncbi:MAG TPA: phage BR0599 family protein [Selenomonadales bacterium]|nr:phage BR0599 family protein [Selenomonadales bacterium]
MADSNIGIYENSIQDGQPIECYKFTYKATSYLYTSDRFEVLLLIQEGGVTRTETYAADYIQRGGIKASSKGDSASLAVQVTKDHPVAKLFQGAPPDQPVMLELYRLHDQDHAAFDKIFVGEVVQANLEESTCELTVRTENWLSRQLPNLSRQFFCGNVIFDGKCRLRKEDWAVNIYIDRVDGLTVTSAQLADYAENYFAGGFFYFGDNVRMIQANKENKLILRYPFPSTPMNNVTIYPGCDHLFRTCAVKFQNTLNFTGCPYVPPTTGNNTKVGQGVYWVDSLVVQRDTNGYVGTISM